MALSRINTNQIVDGAVATADIADGLITTAKLADGAVTTAKITDGNISTAKLADDAVTNAKVADDAINTAQIADNAVANAQMADNAVGTSEIADDAVTTAKVNPSQTDITSVGTLSEHIGLIADQTEEPFLLSIDVEDNDKKTNIDYGYIEPQIFISSNRLIFNTKTDNILLSANTTLDFNALQNINLSTPKDVVIDSQDIYLGKEAIEDGQPVVLGVELFEVLSELLALLSTVGVAAPAPQPLQVLAPAPVNPAPGESQPAAPTVVGPLGPKVGNIANRLSKILSGNVFVKNNEG